MNLVSLKSLKHHESSPKIIHTKYVNLRMSKENPKHQKGKKTKAEVGKPNDLPIAKRHKSMDSDEDDEEPQNEPGTSSTSQSFVPVLPLNQGPAAS